jgi:diaminopimelate epimerase
LRSERADRRMRIFNADGSEAEMCGNGIRCFVKFCLDQGLVKAPEGRMTVETIPGVLETLVTRDGGEVARVRLSMGRPNLEPESAGVAIEQAPPVTDLPVTVQDEYGAVTVPVAIVSMGNPHAVTFIDGSPEDYALHRIGPLVECHALFRDRTNFEVVRVRDREHIEMRVWERGVGETLACGSGAGASVVAARTLGRVGDVVQVSVPGGRLEVEWDGKGDVMLTGPAVKVFEAEWPQ